MRVCALVLLYVCDLMCVIYGMRHMHGWKYRMQTFESNVVRVVENTLYAKTNAVYKQREEGAFQLTTYTKSETARDKKRRRERDARRLMITMGNDLTRIYPKYGCH